MIAQHKQPLRKVSMFKNTQSVSYINFEIHNLLSQVYQLSNIFIVYEQKPHNSLQIDTTTTCFAC